MVTDSKTGEAAIWAFLEVVEAAGVELLWGLTVNI